MTIQISPTRLKVYRATARKREAALKILIEKRRQHAWIIARQAASILKDEFKASRVVVFGSLVQHNRFHLSSDIDLAVWDIQDYFRAVSRLMDLDPDIEFDLVPVEDAHASILVAISREGTEL